MRARYQIVGLALLLLGALMQPAAGQVYYEFLPDSTGARLLRQARVSEMRWTLEDLRYHSTSLYRVVSLDGYGGMHFRNGNEPAPEAVGPAAVSPVPLAGLGRAPVIKHDGRGRPILEVRTGPGGKTDTLASYRYSARGDTAWATTREYGRTNVERSFTESNGRVYRYDRLEYRHPKHAPEAPLFLNEVKSYYVRFDGQHRQVENGNVDSQPAIEAWMSERLARGQGVPGGARYFIYGGGMYQLQLSGRVKGEYRPTRRVLYDRLGRVSETWSSFGEGLRLFRYDGAGRVLEVTFLQQDSADGSPGAANGSAVFEWGPDGLPQRVQTLDGGGKVVQISTYTYARFPLGPATR